jgi:dGTPase
LAGKTQVVASDEYGLYHTRLTHSLKVAQLGRRAAERLRDEYENARATPRKEKEIAPPDPDLVEAACLSHDIGHPPFGHIGEEMLCHTFDRLALAADPAAPTYETPLDKVVSPTAEQLGAARRGGFEGNAQTFRVLDYLATRLPGFHDTGLNLTSATLDAATKYPWLRVTGKTIRGKWGAIAFDADRLKEIRDIAGVRWKAPKSFEAQLMDWCDDVTYAVHDVVDFYRSGFIPLHRLFALSGGPKRRSLSEEGEAFLREFLEANPGVGRTRARQAWVAIAELSDFNSAWEPTNKIKAATQAATSEMITYFLDGLSFEDEPCRHNGTLLKDNDKAKARQKELAVEILKYMLRFYVIDGAKLRTLQHGQALIVQTLLEIYADDPEMLPADRAEEFGDHGDALRAATDFVASLTEPDAQALYRRLTGHRFGALTDAVV